MYTYRLGMTILQTELFYKYYSKESFEKTCVILSTDTCNSNDDVMIGKLTRFRFISNDNAAKLCCFCFIILLLHLQGPSCPDPSEVYVDTKSLRYDRVSILEKGSPNSLCLKESGKVGFMLSYTTAQLVRSVQLI